MKADSANLDMLRALAVTCVVIAHGLNITHASWISKQHLDHLGRTGVLFFFVHTSLVLMMSLERQIAKSGSTFTWLRFMIRRVFRIYPLSILAVALTVTFPIL